MSKTNAASVNPTESFDLIVETAALAEMATRRNEQADDRSKRIDSTSLAIYLVSCSSVSAQWGKDGQTMMEIWMAS